MKTLSTVAIVVLFVILGTATSFAQIAGSKHDFSGTSWTTNQEICLPCHTPHNAKALTDAPLWNHEVTTSTFSIYTGYDLDATVGQPDGSSKLCLSCHDGTVALENFGIVTNGTTLMTGLANFGTDLTNDHPISFVFDAALAAADGELHNPTTQTSGLGGTINDDLLDKTKVQCSSCHDPHNKGNLPDMLRKSNTASALCLTCHNK